MDAADNEGDVSVHSTGGLHEISSKTVASGRNNWKQSLESTGGKTTYL